MFHPFPSVGPCMQCIAACYMLIHGYYCSAESLAHQLRICLAADMKDMYTISSDKIIQKFYLYLFCIMYKSLAVRMRPSESQRSGCRQSTRSAGVYVKGASAVLLSIVTSSSPAWCLTTWHPPQLAPSCITHPTPPDTTHQQIQAEGKMVLQPPTNFILSHPYASRQI